MLFYSNKLKLILDVEHGSLDQQINLSDLAKRVADTFGDKSPLVMEFFANLTGQMQMGTVNLHLLDVAKHDSVVRDVETTGHLAKFLCRLDVFRKTSDSRIFGMPNRLFDRISLAEREEFFARGNILILDAELLLLPDLLSAIDREGEILKKFSVGP